MLKTSPLSNQRKSIEEDYSPSDSDSLLDVFGVYPNPNAGGEIHLTLPKGQEIVEVSIYDMKGIKVFEANVVNRYGSSIEPNLPSGIFVIELKSGDNLYRQKLCVIK